MDSTAQIQILMDKARAAQAIFEKFNQQQVDAVVKALGKSIFDNARLLAEEAVAETGMGDVESKVRKQQGVAMSHWDFVKDKKSVGIIEEDPIAQVVTYAKPIGVIACITPTTNPTSTVCGNGIYAFKSRNAMIVAPHPRSKKVTAHGVAIARQAIAEAGGPADLLQVIEEPNIELTQKLMAMSDATIATGGPAMVKAAYSSGRPSFGVGPGNVQSIIDSGCRDYYDSYAEGTIRCRTTDNGIQCTAEQCLHLPRPEKEAILGAFVKFGAVVIEDGAILDRLRAGLFKNGALNVEMVGKTAPELAKIFGVPAPEDVKVLVVKANGVAPGEILCKEKLCPVISYLCYDRFEEAVANAKANLTDGGAGHSTIIFSNDQAHIDLAAKELPVARLSINTPNTIAGGNSPMIGYNPTISLGCGTWGNNSISENITYRHLMNTTKVGTIIKNASPFNPDEIWK
ncbi:MAG: aldehyde dehydrogenase family protein [Candidatus Adiutrix sp.]|nr:aldehyde dehydrogenase family protein [Candidatus Adiutrix sp.]